MSTFSRISKCDDYTCINYDSTSPFNASSINASVTSSHNLTDSMQPFKTLLVTHTPSPDHTVPLSPRPPDPQTEKLDACSQISRLLDFVGYRCLALHFRGCISWLIHNKYAFYLLCKLDIRFSWLEPVSKCYWVAEMAWNSFTSSPERWRQRFS